MANSIQSAVDIAKSNTGFFTGLTASKKYAITVIFVISCILFAEHWQDANGNFSCNALYAAAIAIAAYVMGQSMVEYAATKAAGKPPSAP